MTDQPMIEPTHHPMVIGAMARLAGHGGWARMLAGKPLEDDQDINDAELLVAARVLRRTDDDGLEPAETHPWYFDPSSLAGGMLAVLRRALRHAEGADAGWSAEDMGLAMDQGRSSGAAALSLGEDLLMLMPQACAAFEKGGARFLDIGVGVGVVCRQLCDSYPGTTAVGIDVLPEVVDLARTEVAAAGLSESVELRVQSVIELDDVAAFDLAWLPQAFIPRVDLAIGLRRVFRALKADRWLVSPICAVPDSESNDFHRAVAHHGAHLTGGGPISVTEMTALLIDAGFVDVRQLDPGDQVVMMARHP